MAHEHATKLAVLIDADNAQPTLAEALLAEVAKYGTAHVKRAYGDWTSTHLKGWKEQLLKQSIQPIQQFGYTSGKNATDSAMIIDEMDLLYSGRFDGFCIVSSDSDFTRLAVLVNLLRNAVEAASDDDGWAALGGVGSIITKQRPNFDARSYGYNKLSELITATTLFEIDRRSPGEGRPKVIYVRNKTKKPATREQA